MNDEPEAVETDEEPEADQGLEGDEPAAEAEEPALETFEPPPLPRLAPEQLLNLAESPGMYLPGVPTLFVFQAEGFAFVGHGRSAWVHRLRLEPEDVERAADRVEAILGLKGFESASWWLSELSTPEDLAERLTGLGFEPDDPPELLALALQDPPEGEPELEVRRVASLEEHLQASELDWACFEVPEEERELRRTEAKDGWPQLQANPNQSTYLAFDDGEPVGFGRVVFTHEAGILLGGATLPEARGQGVYTALVHARWNEAVARRVPRLAVSAGPQSAPILQSLGFEEIGHVRALRQRL